MLSYSCLLPPFIKNSQMTKRSHTKVDEGGEGYSGRELYPVEYSWEDKEDKNCQFVDHDFGHISIINGGYVIILLFSC